MDTSTWKWFRYDEIFDIKHGFYNKKPEDNPEGDIPFIGATDSNNGVTSHSDLETIAITTKTGDGSNSPMSEKIFENCIAVTNNGSVGYAYYQAKPFTCTHDVNPLYLKGHEINPYIALFLCTIIEKERFRWAYGRKWRPIRMPSSMIKLPVTPQGTPDWQYMENFIKDTILPQLPKKAQKVWLKKYNPTPMKIEKMQLNTKDWKWFQISDFCDKPYKAKAYNANELEECYANHEHSILYVTRTDVNNGCKGFVINENFSDIEDGNAITIGDTTSTIFYQKQRFICGDHMVVLRSKHFNIYTGLFITTLLNKERFRYNYGRAFTMDILEQTRIKLPVTPSGDPDWQFMEDYIKSLPYSKNLEPSDPNEVVDELMEVKRRVIEMQKQLAAQQPGSITNYGTVNIYEK